MNVFDLAFLAVIREPFWLWLVMVIITGGIYLIKRLIDKD
jgi:hypothetical protein